jgi:hypothetical protein
VSTDSPSASAAARRRFINGLEFPLFVEGIEVRDCASIVRRQRRVRRLGFPNVHDHVLSMIRRARGYRGAGFAMEVTVSGVSC